MKELLERWAILEPDKCKRETRPNWDWHEEFEYFYIASEAGNKGESGHGWGWQLVLNHSGYHPDDNEALGRIQWAVQQAIIARSGYFAIEYRPKEQAYRAIALNDIGVWGLTPTQALLGAYLDALESEKDDNQP